jgi:class III poly(R)-hydroxyalkanoic acid synthase PhaE subunit
MSPHASHPFDDYQNLAEQSLEAWKSLWSRAVGSVPGDAGATWSAPFGNAAEAGVERLLEGLKSYCAWLESVSAASAAAPGGLRWDQAFAKAFGGNLAQPFAQAFGDLPDLGVAGPEQWMQQFMRAASPMQQSLRGLLDLPAFGLAREHQEQSQKLGRAWLDYLEQSARYQTLIARVGRTAAERLQEKLADRDAPGRQVESLRALYDLWVDAAEDAYAELALSDEFREVYGAMVNAQMRVRSLVQQQVEETSAQLGVPTRSEVDSLGQRVQELRRHAAPATMQAMREELAQLREELAELRRSQRRGAAVKATKTKAAAATKSGSKSGRGKPSTGKR